MQKVPCRFELPPPLCLSDTLVVYPAKREKELSSLPHILGLDLPVDLIASRVVTEKGTAEGPEDEA